MELKDFKRAYNARIKEMGAQARAECLGVIKKTDYSGPDGAAGKAELLSVRTQGIGRVHIDGTITGCIVHVNSTCDALILDPDPNALINSSIPAFALPLPRPA